MMELHENEKWECVICAQGELGARVEFSVK